MIYLDYNATTPVDAEVAQTMLPFLTQYFGNPSSSHVLGRQTKEALEHARLQIANMIGAKAQEIVFTSGGTESNNYALRGVAFSQKHKGNHIITSSMEHPAITQVCDYLATQGFEISYLPVDQQGMVSVEDLKNAITPKTILVSIMHANNEVGSIQAIKELAEVAKSKGILFHSDAAQSIGKIKSQVQEMGVDLMSIAGHKLYAPKGIGALYVKEGVVLEKLIHGANHENNQRAGTENVLEIVGFGKAAELISENLEEYQNHYAQNRDLLWQMLQERWPQLKRNADPEKVLPNTLSVSFPNLEANVFLHQLKGVAASAGAACHTDSISISSVLEAMKLPLEYAMGTVRFSTGRGTKPQDIRNAVLEIERVLKLMNWGR
ncbi:MAG: cysteine desulfurase NifS [Bacteroidetes bacterium 4572_77]|nr:MAG: cysteine desulfurase NifS [Bacteroidetes bacterium 4572_77]